MTLGDSVSDDPSPTTASPLPSSSPTTLSSDVSHPSISVLSVKESSWGTVALLDKASNNYAPWSRHVTRVLRLSSGLDIYLKSSFKAPDPDFEPRAYRNWEINDAAVQAFLLMKCAASEHEFVENCETAQDIWSTLQKRHVHQGPMSQITLIQEALALRYSSSTLFSATTLLYRDLNRRIWDMGAPTPEGFLCILMLLGLSSDPSLSAVRDSIISGLSSATPDRPYTSADIVTRLDYEQQARSMAIAQTVPVPAEAHAARSSATSDIKQSICSNCKKSRHTAEFCVQPNGGMAGKSIAEAQQARDAKRGKKPKEKSKDSTTGTTGTAGSIIKSGHQAYIVDADGKAHEIVGLSTTSSSSTDSAHFLQTDDLDSIDPLVLDSMCAADVHEYAHIAEYSWLAAQDSLHASVDWRERRRNLDDLDLAAITAAPLSDAARRTSLSLDSSPFLLDSACTTHISPDRSDFMTLHPIADRTVTGVGGSSIKALGIGTMKLIVGKGSSLLLENVLFIPSSTVRLISIACITESLQCSVTFDSTTVTLKNRSGSLFATGTRLPTRKLYRLDCTRLSTEHAFHMADIDTWHRRLGHASNQCVLDLATKQLAQGMLINLSRSPPKCDSCIRGKQGRTPVPKTRQGERSHRKLGVIYVDLTGPEAVKSASGNLYVMNIVDDYSSHPWTFCLKLKSDALSTLQIWARRAEAESGERIGIIRVDGGELKSDAMNAWCDTHGYTLQFTAPYTSAHNGRVECMHLTIMNRMRAMRASTPNVPPNRWDEFAMTAGYLSARTPTRTLQKTPFEAWHGKKPDLSHLREIGSRAFALILKHNPKIYERSFECILVGYSPNSKAYRLYHPSTHRLFESFHVKFIERKDNVSQPLFPGRVIDIPVTVDPDNTAPIPISGSSSHKHTSVQDEEEPVTCASSRVWTNDTEVPVLVPHNPADVPVPADNLVPVPADNLVPIPALDADTAPRRSTRTQVPSSKVAETLGIPHMPRVAQAVAESREAGRRLKEQRAQAKFDRRQLVLDHRASLTNTDTTLPIPPTAVPDDDLPPLPIPDAEADFVAFCEAYAVELASPLINPRNPDEPTFREAMNSPDAAKWTLGIQDELKSLKEMGVYQLVPRSDVPAGRKVLRGKWVLLLKRDEHGNPVRHKARFVVKGFEQVFGQDYVDTTSPTARMESVRLLLNIAAAKDWDVQQIDVKTAFLYGLLPPDEAQYLEQPDSFAEPGKEDWVWCLQRGLYGMKQSGRIWNKTMHKAMLSWGFKRLHADPCVYYRVTPLGTVLSAVHVDDFLIVSSSPGASQSFKDELKSLWTISDLGEARFCVGIAISRDRANRLISISQTALIDRVIQQFGQTDADPISTPMDPSVAKSLTRPSPSDPPLSDNDSHELARIPYRSLVGSLMYLAVGTRPDISFAVARLCQFLDCYRRVHWNAAIRVVRYLKSTRLLTLNLGGDPELDLVGFSDSSYADCPDTARSTMGYCFSLGGAVFTWSSCRQKTVSNSSCEAEYIALSEASREALWLRQFLREVHFLKPNPTVLLCDNNGAKALSSDPTHHSRSKHIDVRHHFVRERVDDGSLTIWRVPGHDNVADIFTKALPRPDFTRLRPYLGLR